MDAKNYKETANEDTLNNGADTVKNPSVTDSEEKLRNFCKFIRKAESFNEKNCNVWRRISGGEYSEEFGRFGEYNVNYLVYGNDTRSLKKKMDAKNYKETANEDTLNNGADTVKNPSVTDSEEKLRNFCKFIRKAESFNEKNCNVWRRISGGEYSEEFGKQVFLHLNNKLCVITTSPGPSTCTDPNSAIAKPMVSMFDEVILVPRTDYGSLQMFFYNKLQKIRSIPRDYCVQSLAQLLQGYGFGYITEVFDKVMTPERIVKLHIKPLHPTEFLEKLLEEGIEPTTLEDYKEYADFFIQNGDLKKEREEYAMINTYREVVYTKLAKEKNKKQQQ